MKDFFRLWLVLGVIFLNACLPVAGDQITAPAAPPARLTQAQTAGLSASEIETLSSLRLVDPYPLYSMDFSGSYGQVPVISGRSVPQLAACPAWGCSLFAALDRPASALTGRNFDWQYSPALLLFTAPPHGYASVSMVDIAYLGFDGSQSAGIEALPLEARRSLLSAPFLPFDGMNASGLTVSMAAVSPGGMLPDPAKQTVDSLAIIRLVLDQAASVDQAVEIFRQYNIDYGSGPPLHYLVADSAGQAVVIEYYQGEMYVFPNEAPWHAATNFLLAEIEPASAAHTCWRYDLVTQVLAENEGRLSAAGAMQLLSDVSQAGSYPTQWSVVYEMGARRVHVVMGRQYGQVHTFSLPAGQ